MIWISCALAADVPHWAVDDFGAAGVLGAPWSSGYDDWLAVDGDAHPATDDSLEPQEFGAWADGAAQDGWLVQGDAMRDGSVKARFSSQDDDAFGVVARYAEDAMYVAVYSEDAVPPPVHLANSPTVFLIRVEGGVGVVMGQEQVPQVSEGAVIQLRVNDDRVQVRFDGENVITFVDGLPLPAGQSGLYAYDCSGCLASSVEAVWIDEEDDGVPDDLDNCPDDVNPDQEDFDGDGEGDACDETPRQDSGRIEESGPDSDVDQPTDTGEEPVVLEPDCGCASGPAGGAVLALLAATSLRRRRRACSSHP